MLNIVDLSRRRGAIVHLFPQVYRLIKNDGIELPNIILWKKDMNKKVVDVNRRWVFALEGTKIVKGMLFYHLEADGHSIYIDTLIAAGGIFDGLIKKFEQDDAVKAGEAFYVSRDIKREADEEILKNVGLHDDSVFDDEGYQLLGGLNEAVRALRVRYL